MRSRHCTARWYWHRKPRNYTDHSRAWDRFIRDNGFAGWDTGAIWHMDHIVPVVEGGGACGLENLRTLCICCHKKETRELARRLAEQRRGQPSLALEGV